ncbi:hypothetical protein VK96_25765 [Bacillus cereus]|uniref:hypothetical protein n=1 Tax=Bacillus cereus TaxID=1396 RepID=UPI00065DAE38|nr:hypothetical protein [Bacillus cereus]KMN65686.1 hypothetical protein VK96_25765 [Bacillus cereus]
MKDNNKRDGTESIIKGSSLRFKKPTKEDENRLKLFLKVKDDNLEDTSCIEGDGAQENSTKEKGK